MCKEIWCEVHEEIVCEFIEEHGREPHENEKDLIAERADARYGCMWA